MPAKCVLVEVVIGGISLGIAPEKVAQQVKWALEGATVPNFDIHSVTADESAESCSHPTAAERLSLLDRGNRWADWRPQRPSSDSS